MDIERARWLVGPEGRAALEALPPGLSASDPNRLVTELRRRFPPAQAGALAEQATLRERAIRNHGAHRDFLFTADGLQMMTHPLVAERRAARLVGYERVVVDLTVGVGGDLYAVAQQQVPCAGMDLNPVHALLAATNTRVPVVHGNAERAPFEISRLAVIIDPSRRSADLRRFDPAAFAPRWDEAVAVAASAAAAVMKAPPGIDASYLPPETELEAIQLGRSMREVSIWFGQGARPGLRRAVLLPAGDTIDSGEAEAPAKPGPPGTFLFDPESCVTRATLVRQLAHRVDALLLDPHIAYLAANHPAFSPFAATFEVLEAMPFSVARLKQRLRAAKWRPDEIRRRAFPVEPDELRRLLGRLEGDAVTLVCTTIANERVVFICRRLFEPA